MADAATIIPLPGAALMPATFDAQAFPHAVDLAQHRTADTVEVLRALTVLAERGQLRGLVFAAKLGHGDHHTGTTGDYRRDPCETLAAASILAYHANQANAMRGRAAR